MPFLVKQTVTATNVNGDSFVHPEGTVLSDWELSDFLRSKIIEGSEWYRERFEPLLEREAHQLRVKATADQGPREIDGQQVLAPFDDYVGLHPTEIVERMKTATLEKIRQIRLFERAGMNRSNIVAFVSPAEKEPWGGYDTQSLGDILEKFSILSQPQIDEAKMYEANHQQRPIILDYDKADYGDAQPPAPVLPPPVPPVAPAPPGAAEGAQTSATPQAPLQPPAPSAPPAPPAPMGPPPQ